MPNYWNNIESIYPNLHQDLMSSEVLFESGGKIRRGKFGLAGSEFSFFDHKGYVYNDVSRWKYAPKGHEVVAA